MLELFAGNSPDMIANLNRHIGGLADRELSSLMSDVSENLTAYEAGPYLMTDDRAPVELLGMKVIDELIRDEVAYYKKIYQEKGVKGVIEAL